MGRAITKRLAALSTNRICFSFCKSFDAAKAIENEFPNAEGMRCDFLNPRELDSLLARIPELKPDVLINSAITGFTQKHFHKMSPSVFGESFERNVVPTLKITQRAIECFRKQKSGKIITVLTSYLANKPPVGLSEYVANKAYLESMSRSWVIENFGFNITANCISPSMMITQLTNDMDQRLIEFATESHPLRKLLTPEEVAESIWSLVQTSPHLNGVNLFINGGADVI